MRAIAAGVLVTSSLLSAAPAAALVLCVKKSGVVVQRAECKRKEKPLDLGQFVIVGPKGDKGDKHCEQLLLVGERRPGQFGERQRRGR